MEYISRFKISIPIMHDNIISLIKVATLHVVGNYTIEIVKVLCKSPWIVYLCHAIYLCHMWNRVWNWLAQSWPPYCSKWDSPNLMLWPRIHHGMQHRLWTFIHLFYHVTSYEPIRIEYCRPYIMHIAVSFLQLGVSVLVSRSNWNWSIIL